MRTPGLYLRNRGTKKHPTPLEIKEISVPVFGTPAEKYIKERLPEIDISSVPEYSMGWISYDSEIVLHQDMAEPPARTTGFVCYFYYKPECLLADETFIPSSAELEALTDIGLPDKRWRKTYGEGIGSVCETRKNSPNNDFLLLSEGVLSSIAAYALYEESSDDKPDRAWGYGWAQNGHRVELSEWAHIITIADGDPTGRKAANKIANIYNADVWEMPDGDDAADMYAKKYSE